MDRAEARENLLRAWAAWDDDCADWADSQQQRRTWKRRDTPNPKMVKAMVDAQKEYASHLGISFVHLNDVAMAWRRAGYSRDEALDAVERGRLARDVESV